MRVGIAAILLSAAPLLLANRRHVAAPPGTPTFSREVVRIFQAHCQSCHRPEGIGPFSLTEYASAKPYAQLIRFMTASRRMPPFRPTEGCGDFSEANRLSSSQMATIAAWVNAGAPEGNRAELPPPLAFRSDWTLGPPDVIAMQPKPYLTHRTNEDTHRLFPLPTVFDRDVYVTAMEIRPGAGHYVHHVAVYTDASGKSDEIDAADEEPGYRYDAELGFEAYAFLGTWTPGQKPFLLPEGTAIKVPKGSKVVMDLHIHPHHGHVEPDQTMIGLHLADTPIRKLVNYGSVNNTSFVIPAGDPAYKVTQSWTTDRPMEILGIGGHAHALAKTFRTTATLPDGSTKCLIYIDDWDWNWQGLHTYSAPLPLPAGTRLDMEGAFDNSASNPNQHFHPPRDIPYGGHFDDEMCFAYFTFIWGDEVVNITP